MGVESGVELGVDRSMTTKNSDADGSVEFDFEIKFKLVKISPGASKLLQL